MRLAAPSEYDLREQHRALRVGEFRSVLSERLYAFERHTDRALETVVVLANPTAAPVTERIMVANAGLLDGTPMVNLLAGPDAPHVGEVGSGFMTVTLPPETAWVLAPRLPQLGGYNRYKRTP